MKRKCGLLWMSLGSILTLVFTEYIAPLIEIAQGDLSNKFTLRSTKMQCDINDINRAEQDKQEKFTAPLGNAVGFMNTDDMGSYDEEYDDEEYED